MEGIILLGGVILIFVVAVKVIKYLRRVEEKNAPVRHCLVCGFNGKMKTWLGHYGLPQFIALILLFLGFIPGIIFIVWAHGKYKCTNCGALGKNTLVSIDAGVGASDFSSGIKTCPFCAENIKADAIKCRYCGSSLLTT